ncbi:unnamed protein product, partial [Symbiodinium necroappetens]
MARKVGFGSKKPRSTAKREAQKAPTVRMLPKAKRDYIIDDRPSQRSKRRKVRPSSLAKGKYEAIQGTRVQPAAGGKHVRVVIQDGRTFDPKNVRAARRHLKQLASEAEELARIHGTKDKELLAKSAAEISAKAADYKGRLAVKAKQKLINKKRKRKGFALSPVHVAELPPASPSIQSLPHCSNLANPSTGAIHPGGSVFDLIPLQVSHVARPDLPSAQPEGPLARQTSGRSGPSCGSPQFVAAQPRPVPPPLTLGYAMGPTLSSPTAPGSPSWTTVTTRRKQTLEPKPVVAKPVPAPQLQRMNTTGDAADLYYAQKEAFVRGWTHDAKHTRSVKQKKRVDYQVEKRRQQSERDRAAMAADYGDSDHDWMSGLVQAVTKWRPRAHQKTQLVLMHRARVQKIAATGPAPAPAAAPSPAPAPLTAADVAPELEKSLLRAKKHAAYRGNFTYADASEGWAVAAQEAAKVFRAAMLVNVQMCNQFRATLGSCSFGNMGAGVNRLHLEEVQAQFGLPASRSSGSKAASFASSSQKNTPTPTAVNPSPSNDPGTGQSAPGVFGDSRNERWLNEVKSAGRIKRTVTFPVGDWFLGVGDGGIGRDKDNPAGGALIKKGSLSDFDENDRPPQWETMTSATQDQDEAAFLGEGASQTKVDRKDDKKAMLGSLGLDPSSDQFKQSHEPPPGGWTNNARAGVQPLPERGYGGELQLLEDHRSQTLTFSDLTDSSRFTCQQN